jgi:hypothetical protein
MTISTINENCSCCERPEDNRHHFFIAASLERYGLLHLFALELMPYPIQAMDFIQVVVILWQGPSQATTGIIFSIMWCLWKTHNNHKFNSLNWSVARGKSH